MRKIYLLLTTALFLSGSFSAFSQVANDFRSIADGNWNIVTNWEQHNGSNWVAASYYPGNGATNAVTVNNIITANVALNLTNNLIVTGSLTLGASNFTVGGTTSISGSLIDNNNSGITTFTGSVTTTGSGTFTTTTVVTNGLMILSNNFNQSSTGTSSVGTATIGGNLIVNDGTFSKNAAGTLTVNGTTTINNSGAILLSNNSACVFVGKITANNSSTWTSTVVATAGNMVVQNGFTQNSTGAIAFGAATFANNSQEINIANNTGNVSFASAIAVNANVDIQNSGDGTFAGSITFSTTVTIANNITVINKRNTLVFGALNGAAGATNATWVNNINSTLEYRDAAAPMTIGVLNVTANGNTVYYNRGGVQTLKLTDYHHLVTGVNNSATARNKTFESFAGTFTIAGNVFIGRNSSVYLGTGAKNITVNGNITTEATAANLYTQDADVIHTLTIGGAIINNGATIQLQYSAARYCNVIMTSNGNLIQGSAGSIRLANLTLTNADAKTCSYNGNIDFYSGGIASFTNNGGAFTATNGTFRFLDAFSIQGTGSIEFNNLQVGNNNQTIQTLERDVTVNGTLTLNHNNTASSYLDIKNNTLNILGNYTLTNSGDFGSSTGAGTLNLGNGNTPTITGSLRFETPIGTINHNVTNGFSLTVNALTVGNFNNTLGTFTATQNVTINQNLTNNATFNQTAGTTTFTNANGFVQTSGGTPSTTLFNVVVANDATVTNRLTTRISGTLNGQNAASTWLNDENSTLNYFSATAPMVQGIFDVDRSNSTVNYALNGVQSLRAAAYRNLTSSGGNTKTLGGNVSVNGTLNFDAGTLAIGANTLTLAGNLTGTPLLTGGATSNLTVDDAGASPSITLPSIANLLTLTLNRVAGVSLGGSIVTTNLTLTNGKINLASNNLTVTNITGFSSSNYIIAQGTGTLRRTVAASNVVFPIGTSSSYLPLTLNNAGTSDTYFVNLFGSVTDNGTTGGTPIGNNVVNATWVVNELVAGGSNLTVTAQWNLANEAVVFDRANSMLAYYNAGAWNKTAPTAASGSNPYTQVRTVGANIGSFAAVDQLFLGVPGQWTGNTSTDWNTPSNWADFSIPDGTVDVTIPAGRPNYPIITGNATCNNLNIQNGGTINANTSNFTVNGNTTVEGVFSDGSNTGVNTFVGSIVLSGNGSWNTTAVTTSANTIIRNGIINNSLNGFVSGAISFNANNQSIQGAGAITIGAILIANNIEVTNQTSITVSGALNGGNADSKWINANNSSLFYTNATQPMATGVFDVDQLGSLVSYSGIGVQSVKITDYYNLKAEGGNTKTFASNGSINIINNLNVASSTTLQAINVVGQGLLTVNGLISNEGTLTLQRSSTQFIDLILTNSGNIITGGGTFTFANLTLNNALAKSIDATGIISFNTGNTANRINSFTNNGGTFSATNGTFSFIDATTFSINGTGAITFNNLQSGNNNASVLTLEREVTVNGLLTINHNATTGYIALNNRTLNVNGNITRTNSGQFRGTATSTLNLGNGTTTLTATSNFAFQTGHTQGTINHNTAASGFYYTLASPATVANLNIIAGELRSISDPTITNTWVNNGTYTQTAGTTTFNKDGSGEIVIDGGNFSTFYNFAIADGTRVTTTRDFYVQNNFTSSSNTAPAFNATGGTVYFNRTGATEQNLMGDGTGTVSFHNLSFLSTVARNIWLWRDITVTQTTYISNNSRVYFRDNRSHSITLNNVNIGDGVSGWLITRDADRNHTLTINGKLHMNTGAYFYLWYNANRYVDVTFTNTGEIVSGGGAGAVFRAHSLAFTGAGIKQFNYGGRVEMREGSLTPNSLTNNNGLIQFAGNTEVRFYGNTTAWNINGDSEIAFGELFTGDNTSTSVTLNTNIFVDTRLYVNSNNVSWPFDLNGRTLTLNGNHARQGNGRIKGGGISRMVVNGTGGFTSSFAFDQTTPGTSNLLNELVINRADGGAMLLGNLMEVNTLNINNGNLNSSAGSILVHTATNINGGSFIDNSNTGTNTFRGTTTIGALGTFNPTSTSVLTFSGNLINNGTFIKLGGGNTVFETTTLSGSAEFNFNAGTVLVQDGHTATNQSTANGIGVSMPVVLNGLGTGIWRNEGILTYSNATEPMRTGTLNASPVGNYVIYNRVDNTQYLKNTTYHHLHLINGGYRTMRDGNITINGDLLIGIYNIFYTQQHHVYGNATGTLTMLENSQYFIGRWFDVNDGYVHVGDVPRFVTNFTKVNIILDPESRIAYNWYNGNQPLLVQEISHVPNYAILHTRQGGNRVITGDVTVNTYALLEVGTFLFSNPTFPAAKTVTINGDLYGNGGTIRMPNDVSHTLNLHGEINQIAAFWGGSNNTVNYLSSGTQTVLAGGQAADGTRAYGTLNLSGGGLKILEGSIDVATQLRMNGVVVQLGDFNLRLLGSTTFNAAINPAQPFSSSNMIETNGTGRLQRYTTGIGRENHQMIYPIGSSGKYTPMEYKNIVAGGTGTYTTYVRVVPERHPSVEAIYDALIRYWNLESNITTYPDVEFTFEPTDVIGTASLYNVYRWSSTTFTTPAGSSIDHINNKIIVPKGSTNPLTADWLAYDNVTIRETLYSYLDGNWNFIDVWTTDPSGQLLEGSRIPGNNDNVVILPGRTVTLTENLNTQGLIITVEEGAILDLGTFAFNQVVSILQGKGTVRLASNSMPLVSLNRIVEPEGGTIEYNVPDISFVLNNQPHYNNLAFNLPNSANIAQLENNLTLYGNLTVDKGFFKIYKDDATATTHSRLQINIAGDITVETSGSITVGTASTYDGLVLPVEGTTPGSNVPRYYDIYHTLEIGGSLFNNGGSVKFVSSDIASEIRFNQLTTRGAATVRFYNTNNAQLICNGTTDFYNLIVDKGVGTTTELNINASSPQRFRLFGANIHHIPRGSTNPELRKALWIRNGTLRLSGMTTIASLTEGDHPTAGAYYYIGFRGALVIDDRDVTVLISADGPNEVEAAWGIPAANVHGVLYNSATTRQGLILYGNLTVNDGYLSTRMSRGIYIPEYGGTITINGGKLSARQIYVSANSQGSFTQTGGEVELIGRSEYNYAAISTWAQLRTPTINYEANFGNIWSGTGTFLLWGEDNVFTMTGGVMNIYNTTGGGTSRAIGIRASASNMVTSANAQINIVMHRNEHFAIEALYGRLPNVTITKPATYQTRHMRMISDIGINGNLILNGNTILNSYTGNQNLTVSGNFTIGANATYTPNFNNTTLDGAENSNFTINGAITSGLHQFTINKNAATATLVGTNANIRVRNLFNISSGTLNDGGNTLSVEGDVNNSGIHMGTGGIVLEFSPSLTRNIGGNGLGEFGNLTINEGVDIDNRLTANQTINGTLNMAFGVLNIDIYRLRLNGNLTPSVIGDYNWQKLFLTAGNASDGGLERLITGNGTYLFPIATRANGINRYTPTVATITDFADDGYLRINPVAQELATLDQASIDPALQYYWRLRQEGFSTAPNATYVFTYDENDVSNPNEDLVFVPGRVVSATRTSYGPPSEVNTLTKTISFASPEPVVSGSYTAAHQNRFGGTVKIYYNVRGGGWGGRPWNANTSWYDTETGTNHPTDYPTAGDIVVIRGDYGTTGINVTGNQAAAEIIFIREGTYTDIEDLPRLRFAPGDVLNVEKISGVGEIYLQYNMSSSPVLNADIAEFAANDISLITFYMTQNGTYNIAETDFFKVVPTLRVYGQISGYARTASFNYDMRFKNLVVDGQGRLRVGGNYTVENLTRLGFTSYGAILFPNGTEAYELRTKDFLIRNGKAQDDANLHQLVVETGGSNAIEHTFSVERNFTLSNFGVTTGNVLVDLYSSATSNNVILNLQGEENCVFSNSLPSNSTVELYRIRMNKGADQNSTFTFNTPLTLNAPTNLPEKSLVMQNGHLILNNPNINITLASDGERFDIPATSAITVSQGALRTADHQTGIYLYGKLRIENTGQVILGDGSADNRIFIEYKGLTPVLEIAGTGKLEVNSQIRRNIYTYTGSLRYRQTGGEVIIHGRNHQGGRAKLEVLNEGSEFTMSAGTLRFMRGGGGTIYGDLYIRPTAGTITGGNIVFSQGESIDAAQAYRLDSNIPLYNLTLAGKTAATARIASLYLLNSPLTVTNHLLMDNLRTRFYTNNLNVTLLGNMTFNGQWFRGTSDSLIFAGNTQTLTLNSTAANTAFNHFKVKPTTSLTLAGTPLEATLWGSLDMVSGQLIDGQFALAVKRHVINNATFVNTNPANNASGIKLRGTEAQNLSGSGTFGNIEIDNINGVYLLNSLSFSSKIRLTRGFFNIGSHLLDLGLNATIEAILPFSADNMIIANGVFGMPGGIRKAIPAGASSFTYPIGVTGKYTPVTLTVTANSAPGSILVRPVNQFHQTIPVEHRGNVLQYYWYVESAGISNLSGTIALTNHAADAWGDVPNYIGARLLQGEDEWGRFIGAFNSNVTTIPLVGASNFTGEYTAGIDPAFGPIITFTSIANGNWDDPTKWVRTPAGAVPASGPIGGRVVINHTISTNGNRRNSYALNINETGRLNVGTTYGHNFNNVGGTGTLSLDFNTLPAGDYNNFFSCTGGTMEYGGSTTYSIRIDYPIFRNLTITGTGTISSPNINTFTVCETLLIKNNSVFKQTKSANYKGDIIMEEPAGFIASGWWTYLNGNSPQLISGNFTGANSFNFLAFSNVNGFDISNDIEISNNLSLGSGRIRNSGFRFSFMNSTTPLSEQGGNANTFIVGRYRRLLPNNSNTHFFPVGKGNLKKVTGIVAPAGASNSYWTVEYMASNPEDFGTDSLKVESGISRVEQNEFWYIEGPNTYTARLSLSLTGTSAVLDDIVNLSDARIACWNPVADRWEVVGGFTTIAGNINTGTISCNSLITFNGNRQIYAIVSVEPATAQFTSGNVTICQDIATNLVVEFEGVAPFSITYTANGGAPVTVSGITDNPYSLSVSPNVTTTYLLTAMTHLYGNGIIIGSPVVVTVRPRPQVTIDVNSQICQDEFTDVSVDLTAGTAPFSFTYSINGLLQTGINNVADPHTFNHEPLPWIPVGMPPSVYYDYVFRIETVTDNFGCENNYDTGDTKPEDTVRVYKLPQTGPQYHIPNTFGM
jgi:hypothetical protein